MTAQHWLSSQMAEVIEQAVVTHGQGEQIVFDLMLSPDPQSPASGLPVMVVFCWHPGIEVGSLIPGSFIVHNPAGFDPEPLDQMVGRFLEMMRAERSKQLAALTADGAANGVVPPGYASRIIVPGPGERR